MAESVPMTRAGYNKIKAQIDHLENEEMPLITEKIAEAREEGDLKENAEYHAQRENQGMMMAKIGELKDKIARATLVGHCLPAQRRSRFQLHRHGRRRCGWRRGGVHAGRGRRRGLRRRENPGHQPLRPRD